VEVKSTYEALVVPLLEDLRKYCFYLTKSKWDGEDLFQETLLKSMIFFTNTEPYVDVKPFLVRVARNLWIDQCRKQQRRKLLLAQPVKTSSTDNDYVEVRSMIEWLAERFPRRNIEMWLLFQHFDYTMQEIADAMETTVSAVKSVLYRTRELLRNRDRLKHGRRVRWGEIERWSRAIMYDRPQALLSE
jgi:RNA polymerase sigma-70 factor, ECF subfamily